MEVSDIKFWYHQIDLPDGTTTPGISNNKDTMRKLMLPNDMSGIRVLDIGCNQGYFSFECEKRGAIVTSIDTFNPNFWGGCRDVELGFWLCHRLFNSSVRFINADIEQSPDVGEFDIVLAFGTLYHMKSPLTFLEYIAKMSSCVYIETHYIPLIFNRSIVAVA